MNKLLGKLVMTTGINNCVAGDENFAKQVLKALSGYKNTTGARCATKINR